MAEEKPVGIHYPPLCAYCGKPGLLKTRMLTTRRGDKKVTHEGEYWECPSGCEMPGTDDTERYPVFTWCDMSQLRQHSKDAKLAWIAKYSEPMPPGRQIKRKRKESE